MISTDAAHRLAEVAHGSDRTKAGLLFIDHVRRVVARMADDPDPAAVTAALLHDSVEKGSMTWDDLRSAGADDRLLAIVDALTERDGETELEYFTRCVSHPLALRIKRVDIGDKFTVLDHPDVPPTRRTELREGAQRRLDLLERLAQASSD